MQGGKGVHVHNRNRHRICTLEPGTLEYGNHKGDAIYPEIQDRVWNH